jgi:hypothetical protein
MKKHDTEAIGCLLSLLYIGIKETNQLEDIGQFTQAIHVNLAQMSCTQHTYFQLIRHATKIGHAGVYNEWLIFNFQQGMAHETSM